MEGDDVSNPMGLEDADVAFTNQQAVHLGLLKVCLTFCGSGQAGAHGWLGAASRPQVPQTPELECECVRIREGNGQGGGARLLAGGGVYVCMCL